MMFNINKIFFILSFLFVATSIISWAQEIKEYKMTKVASKEDIKFFFQLDKSNFVEGFSTNAEQLKRLDEIMADENALVGVDSLVLVAAASIDGNEQSNGILAKNRAQAVKELLQKRYSKIAPELLRTQSIAEDWTGLRALIVDDANFPHKAEVLKVVDNDREPDTKEWLLKTMKNKIVWNYLKVNILPKTRYGASVVLYSNIDRQKKTELIRRDTIYLQDTLRFVDTIRVDMRARKFRKSYDDVETLEK